MTNIYYPKTNIISNKLKVCINLLHITNNFICFTAIQQLSISIFKKISNILVNIVLYQTAWQRKRVEVCSYREKWSSKAFLLINVTKIMGGLLTWLYERIATLLLRSIHFQDFLLFLEFRKKTYSIFLLSVNRILNSNLQLCK